MNKLNFTFNKLLSFLDNIGFMLLGTALSLAVGNTADLVMAAKFGVLGTASLLAGFLLGLIAADADDTDKKVVVSAKKAKKTKRKKRTKKRKKK